MKQLFALILITSAFASCLPGTNPQPDSIDNIDTTLYDVSYGSDNKQKMDIYLPKNRSTAATKVIVLVHGGGWSAGDKNDMNGFVKLLQQEWPEAAIANINYRLANGSSVIHTQIKEDMQAAVHHLVTHQAAYKISHDLAMAGASAGAHLSLMYTYRYDTGNYVKAVCNIFGPANFADWEFYNSYNLFLGNVKDVMKTYAGQYWDESLYKSLSPYHIVNVGNYKPTITFHGTVDPIVPLYHSQWLHAHLDDLGLDNEYYEYALQGHGFDAAHNKDCVEKTVAFFKANM